MVFRRNAGVVFEQFSDLWKQMQWSCYCLGMVQGFTVLQLLVTLPSGSGDAGESSVGSSTLSKTVKFKSFSVSFAAFKQKGVLLKEGTLFFEGFLL